MIDDRCDETQCFVYSVLHAAAREVGARGEKSKRAGQRGKKSANTTPCEKNPIQSVNPKGAHFRESEAVLTREGTYPKSVRSVSAAQPSASR